MALGALSYGTSLVLFILAMRELGAARTGAYFATAPFFGAAGGLLLGEALTARLIAAAALMAAATWLLVHERHSHRHRHAANVHSHRHVHDAHHQHAHDGRDRGGCRGCEGARAPAGPPDADERGAPGLPGHRARAGGARRGRADGCGRSPRADDGASGARGPGATSPPP